MTNTNSLPRYRCHKEVQAAKITDVNISNRGEPVLTIEGGALQPVTKEYIEKHDPQTGGYFVLYEDGYQSYSPAVAFESGYTSIENLNVMERELKSAPSEIIINSKPLKYSVSAPEGTESVTLNCQQMVKLNGIPFFLMEDVQAYTGSKGNVALAFGEPPKRTSYVPSGSGLYRKKPVVIEARQFNGGWTGDGTDILTWMGKGGDWNADAAELRIRTLEGVMTASKGDWIIKGVKGEFYPCKPDIFAATYEAVEAEYIDLEAADFSDALLWLKEGKRVCRAGWNGKRQYVILIPGDHLARSAGYGFGEHIGEFTFGNVLALKNAQNIMQPGWVPSMGDLMATDWQIYDGVAGADERQAECVE